MPVNHTSRITGQEARIQVPDGDEIAVTNVSFEIDVNTTDVQTNQGLKPAIATTGLRYSGSFEYDGEQDDIRNKVIYSASDSVVGDDQPYEQGEPKRVNMTVKEDPPNGGNVADDGSGNLFRTWTLKNVVITGMSRDIPSDDVASTSWDFEAEKVYVSDGGASGGSSGSSI